MPPNTNTQLDPDAVNLTKAIRQTESGGNFKASGKSGEYGAYQFTEPTWNATSAKYGVNVHLKDATPEQQNEVAYKQVKEWKDKGNNVGQIASMWNAGEKRPNAYLENNVGTNKYGVHYDTPTYAKNVATTYQELKKGKTNTPDVAKPVDNRDALQKTSDVVGSIFPGKQVGQAIGTLGGLAYEKLKGAFGGQDNSKYYDTSAPSPLQVAGDVAQGALMVGTGMPEEAGALNVFGKEIPTLGRATTTLGRIGQSTAIGAGFGLTGGLKEGETNVGQLSRDTLTGGAVGGALGGASELVSKVANSLPKRIASSFLKGKGVGDKEIQYALDKGLGSPKSMLSGSDTSIKTLGGKLGDILTSPQYKDFTVPGRDILNKVAQDFPDAGLSRVDLVKKLQSIVPLKASLVKNLLTGSLNLDELHTLNSALGKNTFKTVFDGVEVKANKEIGNAVYHTISDIIKNVAPETVPIFDDLSKEYPLNSSLNALIQRGEKAKFLTLKDLVALSGGFSLGGLPGAASAYGVEKLANSPTVNLKSMGLLNKLAQPGAQGVARATRGPLMNTLIGAINH